MVTVLVEGERVKMVVVDGILPKRLDNPEVLCWLSSTCMEATNGGLKVFVGPNANVSCL